MYSNMLCDIITDTFNVQAGKGQQRERRALLVKFRTDTNYSTEEGYRQLDLLLYAPGNYVGVFIRHRWNVIPGEALEDDEGLKGGYKYIDGESDWVKIGYHDSCWRDSVNSLLSKNEGKIAGFDNVGSSWSEVVELDEKMASDLIALPHGKFETAPTVAELLTKHPECAPARAGRKL